MRTAKLTTGRSAGLTSCQPLWRRNPEGVWDLTWLRADVPEHHEQVLRYSAFVVHLRQRAIEGAAAEGVGIECMITPVQY